MPPKVFQVKRGWLADQTSRLDAAAYGEGGLAARDRIKAGPWPWCPLEKLGEIYLPPRFSRRYVRDPSRGVRFLSSSDMLLADLHGLPLLSRRAMLDLHPLTGTAGSTLVSRSGTIGRTAYWRDEMHDMAVSEHVIHVRPIRSRVLAGYLFAFLTSELAQAMIRQHTFGSVVQHIQPHHLATLPVPLPEAPDQRRIHDLVDGAAAKRTEASRLLDEASAFFDAQAGPLRWSYEHSLALRIVRRSELNARLDGFHHVGWAIETLQEGGAAVADLGEVISTPRVPRIYAARGVPFLSGIDIFRARPTIRVRLARHVAERFGAFISAGELAIQGSGQRYGLLGRAAFVGRRLDGWAASHDLFRIHLHSKVDAGRIYAFLRSEVGRRAMLRHSYGTSIPHVSPTGIAKLRIPELPAPLTDGANQALQLREQADADEERAIREVEAWLS